MHTLIEDKIEQAVEKSWGKDLLNAFMGEIKYKTLTCFATSQITKFKPLKPMERVGVFTIREENEVVKLYTSVLTQPIIDKTGTVLRGPSIVTAVPVVVHCNCSHGRNLGFVPEKEFISGAVRCPRCGKFRKSFRETVVTIDGENEFSVTKITGLSEEKILGNLDEPENYFEYPRVWAVYDKGSVPNLDVEVIDIPGEPGIYGMCMIPAHSVIGTTSRGYRGTSIENRPYTGYVSSHVLRPRYRKSHGEGPCYLVPKGV